MEKTATMKSEAICPRCGEKVGTLHMTRRADLRFEVVVKANGKMRRRASGSHLLSYEPEFWCPKCKEKLFRSEESAVAFLSGNMLLPKAVPARTCPFCGKKIREMIQVGTTEEEWCIALKRGALDYDAGDAHPDDCCDFTCPECGCVLFDNVGYAESFLKGELMFGRERKTNQ